MEAKSYMVTKPGGTPEGPFDEETLKAKIAEGAYSAEDYVWEKSMPKWEPLANYFTVPAAVEETPVPTPPPVPQESLMEASKEKISAVSQAVRANINKENLKKYAGKTNEALKKATGLHAPDTFSFKSFFKEIFRAHSYQEFVSLFSRGTATTTPDIRSISATWPSPWAFSRMLLICIAAFAAIAWGIIRFENMNLHPAFLFVGTFSVPFCVIVFFYEMNIKQDVPFFEVVKAFLVGGIISLLLSLLLFEKSGTEAAYWAGCIEEPGKLLAAILIAQPSFRKGNVLHGMLIGCAVGAGFAAFETAGYVYRYMGLYAGIENLRELVNLRIIEAPREAVAYIFNQHINNQVAFCFDPNMLEDVFRDHPTDAVIQVLKDGVNFVDVMLMRAVYTPFCHVIWTAITAGAFWHAIAAKAKTPEMKSFYFNLDSVRGKLSFGIYPWFKKLMNGSQMEEEDKIDLLVFLSPKFYLVALVPVLLHMFWNSGLLADLGVIRNVCIGLASWFIALTLIQVGIHQVKEEKDSSDDAVTDDAAKSEDAAAEPRPAPASEETVATENK